MIQHNLDFLLEMINLSAWFFSVFCLFVLVARKFLVLLVIKFSKFLQIFIAFFSRASKFVNRSEKDGDVNARERKYIYISHSIYVREVRDSGLIFFF